MRLTQELWNINTGWKTILQNGEITRADFVLCFADNAILSKSTLHAEILEKYPLSNIVFCSTAGEIVEDQVFDASISLIAVQMDHTEIKVFQKNILDFESSKELAHSMVALLAAENLSHVFILSDGHLVNGSDLAAGLSKLTSSEVSVTGGLAGDGVNFSKTLVGLNESAKEGEVVAIGFYGDRLQVGHGAKGGWDAFGPQRLVTKAVKNVLYELDGQSALDIYKKYLGESAKELPGSALYYPLSLKIKETEEVVVRTILSIDEESKAMIFAGEIPEGSLVNLMKHNSDNLIAGAESAATISLSNFGHDNSPDLAILVSCVGRKIVLGQNVEEEIAAVRDLMGEAPAIAGFYSYGELAPVTQGGRCQLHNQTLSITTLKEI